MKTTNRILIVLLLTSIGACNQNKSVDKSTLETLNASNISTDTSKYLGVSIINLIATPQLYHNRKIYVEGFLHMGFEDNGLYQNELDYKHDITRSSLWVDISREQASKFSESQDKYVRIKGTFNSIAKGHYELWSGSIQKVVSMDTLTFFH